MTDGPAVSVVMNAHNSERYFKEALNSALAQTVSNIEVVVWDNSSTVRVEEMCADAEDERIKYTYTPNKVPLYQARIDAVKASVGRYVAFLDCDDLWAPSKLERQLEAVAVPGVVLSCTDYEYFTDQKWDEREYFRAYGSDSSIRHGLVASLVPYRVGMSSLLFQRDVALDTFPEPAPDWFFIEDLDIVSRLLQRGDLVSIPQPLMSYRIHGSNASRDRSAYVRETTEWIADLSNRNYEAETLRVLSNYFSTQALRSEVIQRLTRGERRAALGAWAQMPASATKAKWALALLAPSSLARRFA